MKNAERRILVISVEVRRIFRGGRARQQQTNMAADDGDKKGLVFNEEIPESTHFPRDQVTEYGSTEQVRPRQLRVEAGANVTDEQQEFIIAVFVVSFDTRKGLL